MELVSQIRKTFAVPTHVHDSVNLIGNLNSQTDTESQEIWVKATRPFPLGCTWPGHGTISIICCTCGGSKVTTSLFQHVIIDGNLAPLVMP